MYCKHCGNKIENNTKVCPSCGATTDLVYPLTNNNSNRITMIIVCILCVFMSISPLLKMYAVNFYKVTSFSVYSLFDKTSDIYSALSNLGLNLNFSNSDSVSSSSSDFESFGKIILGVIIFTLIMYVISMLESVIGIVYYIGNKPNNEGKFWKSAVSATISVWIANFIVWGIFTIINAMMKGILEHYGIGTGNLIEISPIHYIIQILAIVIYIIAHVKYGFYKKANKENSQRGTYE